jgi:hypothetical protein
MLILVAKSLYDAFQLPSGTFVDFPTFFGALFGRIGVAYLLWKKWAPQKTKPQESEVASSQI